MIFQRTSIAVALFLAACDAGPEEPANYEAMSFEQRHAFMSEVVLPQMQETFKDFDAKFATMTCATCHGEGASDGTYAMPSPQIARLPASEEAFLEYLEQDPEHLRWSTFMMDEVWPEMAALLELEMFDPEQNPTGFSCSNCHMHEGQT